MPDRSSTPPSPSVAIECGTVRQRLEGFGASGAFDAYELTRHPLKEELYDLLFGTPAQGTGLGLDIYRINNTYLHAGDANIDACGEIVAAAKKRNPGLKIMLVPWSPPAALKSNGGINNGGTLAPGNGTFDYAAYAAWWADSLTDETNGWAKPGVRIAPDYISLQNEPDMHTGYESCLFSPNETADYAGYGRAFDAVHAEIKARVPARLAAMPEMVGPDSVGYSTSPADWIMRGSRDYIDALSRSGKANMYGYSFHPYSDGKGQAGYDNPDNHLPGMEDYAADARYNDKPLFMTEYERLEKMPTFDHAVKLAWHIHNFLVKMKAASYFYWALFRASTFSGMVDFTGTPNAYRVSDLYWFFKHYSYFTEPGWSVVEAVADSDKLRITAFKNPAGDRLTVVMLNISDCEESVPLVLSGFTPVSSEIYRSSSTEHWVKAGTYEAGRKITLPSLSIATVRFYP
ncbi:MAG: hypothetical protein JXD23_13935 [Spirochaetales bacterium]|nr:hypothetical protein [Spirochaetales bacterium]